MAAALERIEAEAQWAYGTAESLRMLARRLVDAEWSIDEIAAVIMRYTELRYPKEVQMNREKYGRST